jgi:hypothetical protein
MATVVAGDELVCLVVDGDRARDVLGTAGGVAFVQASLRRGILGSPGPPSVRPAISSPGTAS